MVKKLSRRGLTGCNGTCTALRFGGLSKTPDM